jgi:hypothetical protein
VIDPDEKLIAKKIVGEEFFSAHEDHLHLFGPKYPSRTVKQNAHNLANSKLFERTYNRLKATEEKLRQIGSRELIEGMTLANQDILKFNYYTNKFDTAAFIDDDALPKEASFLAPKHGSRKHFLFTRKQHNIQELETLRSLHTNASQHRFGRINLITDHNYENN